MVAVSKDDDRSIEKKLDLHVKELIDERGIKHRHVAKLLGMDECGFARMLRGERRFQAGCVPALCKCLGVTPNELFDI